MDAPAPLTPHRRRAIVVGASSGIGAACVAELARQGYQVMALARRQELLDSLAARCNERFGASAVLTQVHDVTGFAEVPRLFDECCDALGGLDCFIYAAGVLHAPGEHAYDFEQDRWQIDVNITGAVAWCSQAAELFTRLGTGTLVGISSIAGERGRRRAPVYGATKAFFTHYLEALRNRLSRLGVRVVTIKPGYVDTEMVRGIPNPLWLISSAEAARRIIAAVHGGPETLYVPRRWMFVAWVLRRIPSRLMRHLNV